MNGADLQRTGEGAYRLSGPLVFETVPGLYQRLSTLASVAGDVVVDLEQVTRADSAGLALLVEWLRLVRNRDDRITFMHIPPQLEAMIRVGGLDGVLVDCAGA